MRSAIAGILVTTALFGRAAAQPAPAPHDTVTPADPPPADTVTPPDPTPPDPTPTVQLQPSLALPPVSVVAMPPDAPPVYHPRAAAATLGGLYAGFIGWMYYAWYAKHKPLADYKFGGDGWLGYTTYAGGEDKFGHAWATMSLARLGTEMLTQWGGYDRNHSIILSTALAELLFIGVEVKDGFFYEFSFSDISGDTAGALMALALSYWPRLDELFDFRVQYFPSSEYFHEVTAGPSAPLGGKLNIAEDYSGQTYFAAFHLGGIHALTDRKYGTVARFVDVAFGFDTRGYKPTPLVDGVPTELPPSQHHQNMFLGVSFNAQGFFDWMFERPTRHETLRKFTHATFEVFNLPFTGFAVPGTTYTRTPTREPTLDGA